MDDHNERARLSRLDAAFFIIFAIPAIALDFIRAARDRRARAKDSRSAHVGKDRIA